MNIKATTTTVKFSKITTDSQVEHIQFAAEKSGCDDAKFTNGTTMLVSGSPEAIARLQLCGPWE